ncbi:prephenate dehydrogenase/arogenate dehydrogenase family protein [Candidatus Dojkabacteria bacterium]|uniref:Prephenate dehydrogenase/arogenate dehydrogenase family protein n=1 Tax=Candidatus Dojkabacteria bacterium TaxID=2099670 RepID=A0A955L920_9BACT|nr:prephenate dehydrogenase/arogenate dehydrogenase family protein [Candidatus Dojkabacteria bacterium]
MKNLSIGIIGYGDFGKFIHHLADTLLPKSIVRISSRTNITDNETFFPFEEVCACDLVFPCVPIRHFKETMEKAVQYLSDETIVFEVNSVKLHPIKILESFETRINYIATHPMFGPYSYKKVGNTLEGLRFVISESNLSPQLYEKITSFLEQQKLSIIKLDADTHDRYLAESLFLTHLVAQSIIDSKYARTPIDTKSFEFLMDAVESVQHDTELFKDIFRYNPHCSEVLKKYKNSLHSVSKKLEEHCHNL